MSSKEIRTNDKNQKHKRSEKHGHTELKTINVGRKQSERDIIKLAISKDNEIKFKPKIVKNIKNIPQKEKLHIRISMKNPRGLSPHAPWTKSVDTINRIKK